jgi:L-ascorbate metabolism protein UlaG (beta-lactamase superfamily)
MRRAGVLAILAWVAAACTALPPPRRSVYHPADADLSVTRIVHGSLIVEMRGTRVLVDPWFHAGLVVRHEEALGLTPDGLPTVTAILLTHRHGDLVDVRALGDLARTVPEVIARPELVRRLAKLGFARVTPLDWWTTTRLGDVEVTAVPGDHGGPENGYVLEAHGVSAYFAGDTRRIPELAEVATRFPALDFAALPVGGERLLGLAREMGPVEAAEFAAELGARRLLPIGYGKSAGFPLRWHARNPVERFVAACKRLGIVRDRIVVLEPGESWHYVR